MAIALVLFGLVPERQAAAQDNTMGGAILGGAAGAIIGGAATGRAGGALPADHWRRSGRDDRLAARAAPEWLLLVR